MQMYVFKLLNDNMTHHSLSQINVQIDVMGGQVFGSCLEHAIQLSCFVLFCFFSLILAIIHFRQSTDAIYSCENREYLSMLLTSLIYLGT